MAARLDNDAIAAALTDLEGWSGDEREISRTVRLDENAVPAFLDALETLAREMNHDPDIDRDASTLTLTMSTHSAGGVTELDVEYARRANALIAAAGSS